MHSTVQLKTTSQENSTETKKSDFSVKANEESYEFLHHPISGQARMGNSLRGSGENNSSENGGSSINIPSSYNLNGLSSKSVPAFLFPQKQFGDIQEFEAEEFLEKEKKSVPQVLNLSKILSTLSGIQRKCSTCGTVMYVSNEPLSGNMAEGKCVNCEAEQQKTLQRKETGNADVVLSDAVTEALQSNGRPLDPNTRAFMEKRFGHDFSKVIIHSDTLAHKASDDIHAHAYTYGNHIVFGKGQFNPELTSGKKLLAHELAHVVQQTGSKNHLDSCNDEQSQNIPGDFISKSFRSKLKINTPGDVYEQEADTIAEQVVNNAETKEINALDSQKSATQSFVNLPLFNGSATQQSTRGANTEPETNMDHLNAEDQVNETEEPKAEKEKTLKESRKLVSSTAKVMAFGRTFGGFFSNLFHFWDYSKETIDKYLQDLIKGDRIIDDDDSDDMARQIVAEWKKDKSSHDLKPRTRVLLIREMLDGAVLGSDQEGILDLLEGSKNSELVEMFKSPPTGLTYAEIYKEFGVKKKQLEFFEEKVLRTLGKLKEPEPKDAKSIEKRLEDVEKEQGIEFKDFSVSFQVAPGKYYKSFKVDVDVPEYGSTVTITLTRTSIKVDIRPGLFIDVLWPVSNATLYGFSLTFAGLKPKLELNGIELVTGAAREQLDAYLSGLVAGTRFAEPGYDPTKDPNLISELADNSIIGDINRLKYNFEKNSEKKTGDEDSKIPGQVSALSYELNLVYKKGMPIPESGYGVMIPPDTKFNLFITTSGSAAELMKKKSHLEQIRINSDGIYIYKGNVKIAALKTVEVDRGLKIKLGEVETFVDLKALAREESPSWAKGAVEKATGLMKSYDDAVDTVNGILTLGGLLGSEPKSDVAKDMAVSLAETYLGWVIQGMLRDQWSKIKESIGLSDQQIEEFFGVPSGK